MGSEVLVDVPELVPELRGLGHRDKDFVGLDVLAEVEVDNRWWGLDGGVHRVV